MSYVDYIMMTLVIVLASCFVAVVLFRMRRHARMLRNMRERECLNKDKILYDIQELLGIHENTGAVEHVTVEAWDYVAQLIAIPSGQLRLGDRFRDLFYQPVPMMVNYYYDDMESFLQEIETRYGGSGVGMRKGVDMNIASMSDMILCVASLGWRASSGDDHPLASKGALSSD